MLIPPTHTRLMTGAESNRTAGATGVLQFRVMFGIFIIPLETNLWDLLGVVVNARRALFVCVISG